MQNPSLSESIDISKDIEVAVLFGYHKAKEEYVARIMELLAENERLEERIGELEECY